MYAPRPPARRRRSACPRQSRPPVRLSQADTPGGSARPWCGRARFSRRRASSAAPSARGSSRRRQRLKSATPNLLPRWKQGKRRNWQISVIRCKLGGGHFPIAQQCFARTTAMPWQRWPASIRRRSSVSRSKAGRRRSYFLFSGQGSQYVHMAGSSNEQEPSFRYQVDACAEILRPHLALDIRAPASSLRKARSKPRSSLSKRP